MNPMLDETIGQLHAILAEALRESREKPFEQPVTVAEIYQDLVPYRVVRGLLGVEMNADYEHALLRLLAGEEERVRLEPAEARDELRAELDSPNPNVALYRKFAACDVWVREPRAGSGDVTVAGAALRPAVPPAAEPGRSQDPHPTATAAGARPAALRSSDDAPAAASREVELADPAAPAPVPATSGAAAAGTPRPPGAERSGGAERAPAAGRETASRTAPAGGCAFCNEPLPGGRSVRYCPRCGGNQQERPCASCGEALDRRWSFCIACGVATGWGPQA
jgi:hypothetical protein